MVSYSGKISNKINTNYFLNSIIRAFYLCSYQFDSSSSKVASWKWSSLAASKNTRINYKWRYRLLFLQIETSRLNWGKEQKLLLWSVHCEAKSAAIKVGVRTVSGRSTRYRLNCYRSPVYIALRTLRLVILDFPSRFLFLNSVAGNLTTWCQYRKIILRYDL